MSKIPMQALHPVEHAELQAMCEESQRRGTIEANLDQLKQVCGLHCMLYFKRFMHAPTVVLSTLGVRFGSHCLQGLNASKPLMHLWSYRCWQRRICMET